MGNMFGDDDEKSVIKISLDKLHDFKNHTYKVIENDDMRNLIDSINNFGLKEPIIVRQHPDIIGHFEIISGHRRCYAAKSCNLENIDAIVEDFTDEEAVISMVDANLHRESLSISEKAKSYRAKYDAMKKLGKTKGNNNLDNLADDAPDNKKTIQRLIKLSYLCDELLFMVDDKKITEGAAYNLAFIDDEIAQKLIVDTIIELEVKKVDDLKAKILREKYEAGTFDSLTVLSVFSEKNVSQKKKSVKLSEKVFEYFPGIDEREIEKKILDILNDYFLNNK